ncbi:MAG: hypothetical protein ACYTEQ_12350 [Planctomycetota bacterium]|jgi:hypothetical protein
MTKAIDEQNRVEAWADCSRNGIDFVGTIPERQPILSECSATYMSAEEAEQERLRGVRFFVTSPFYKD